MLKKCLGCVKIFQNDFKYKLKNLEDFHKNEGLKYYLNTYEAYFQNSFNKNSGSIIISDDPYEVIKNVFNITEFIISESFILYYENNELIKNYLKCAGSYLEYLYHICDNVEKKLDFGLNAVFSYYISNNSSLAIVLIKIMKNNLKMPLLEKMILNLLARDYKSVHEIIFDIYDEKKFNEDEIIKDVNKSNICFDEVVYRVIYGGITESVLKYLDFILNGNEKSYKISLKMINSCIKLSDELNFVDLWRMVCSLKFIYLESFENSLWKNLKKFEDTNSNKNHDLIKSYIKNYLGKNLPITELWPPQIQTIDTINNINRVNFCLKLPTSSGKTIIAELTILRFLLDLNINNSKKSKCFYIAPYRSLSSEIENVLDYTFGNLGFNVSKLYGVSGVSDNEFEKIENSQIIILTPEKLDSLLRHDISIANQIGLLIIDESHLIGDYKSGRGILFELLIQRLIYLFNDGCRILLISAILDNITEFSEWLSGSKNNIAETTWKPTRLSLGFAIWKNNSLDVEITHLNQEKLNIPIRLKKFLTSVETRGIIKNRKKRFPINHKNNQEVFPALILKLASKGTTMAFIPDKRQVKAIPKKLLKIIRYIKTLQNKKIFTDIDLNFIKTNEQKRKISKALNIIEREYGKNSELAESIKSGFVIHHADLSEDIRLTIEDLIRNNIMKLIIATDTLAEGINIPVKTLIIKDIERYSTVTERREPISTKTFWNVIGRAGRAGIENEGTVLLYLDKNKTNNKDKEKKLKEFINSYENNEVKSSLYSIINKIILEYNMLGIDLDEHMHYNIYDSNQNLDNDEFKTINKYLRQLDSQLLAILEENNVIEFHSNLFKKFFSNSLGAIMLNNSLNDNLTREILEKIINYRLKYILKNFKKSQRNAYYRLGLNFKNCENILENKDTYLELFYNCKNWDFLDV